jgi:HD-like signal output (HDOD) protein
MISWMLRMLGVSEARPAPTYVSANSKPGAYLHEDANTTIWKPQIDIDEQFLNLLINQRGKTGKSLPQVEQAIFDALHKLIQSEQGGGELIPRLPGAVPDLLPSLCDQNMSGVELARKVSHDVALLDDVLRQANSSFYKSREPITSVEDAMTVLSKNDLRMVIAKTAFKSVIANQSGRHAKRVAPLLWEQSQSCARACRMLAAEKGIDPFITFLGALMQNVGMIVAFRLIDRIYEGRTLPLSESFEKMLNHHARILAHQVAQRWNLPEAVIDVLAELKEATPVMQKSMTSEAVFFSDQLSKLRMLIDHRALQEADARLVVGMPESLLYYLEQLKLNADKNDKN